MNWSLGDGCWREFPIQARRGGIRKVKKLFRKHCEIGQPQAAPWGEGHSCPESNQGIVRRRTIWYVAQAIPQIDAEIAENGYLWMATNPEV
jgi:hypothetical protein